MDICTAEYNRKYREKCIRWEHNGPWTRLKITTSWVDVVYIHLGCWTSGFPLCLFFFFILRQRFLRRFRNDSIYNPQKLGARAVSEALCMIAFVSHCYSRCVCVKGGALELSLAVGLSALNSFSLSSCLSLSWHGLFSLSLSLALSILCDIRKLNFKG